MDINVHAVDLQRLDPPRARFCANIHKGAVLRHVGRGNRASVAGDDVGPVIREVAIAGRRSSNIGSEFELSQRVFCARRASRTVSVVGVADIAGRQKLQLVIDLYLPIGKAVLGFGAEVEHRALVINAALAGHRFAELVGMNLDPVRFQRFAAAVDVVVANNAGSAHIGFQANHGPVSLFGALQFRDALDDVVCAFSGEFFPKGIIPVGLD